MMTINPFSDLYRIDSDEHIDIDIDKTLTVPNTIPVPYIDALPLTTSSSASSLEGSPASTAPSTPPPPYTSLEWTAADLNYLLSILYPDQTLASTLILESHPENPQDLFSSIRLDLYMRTKSNRVPTSAYAATAPIGTGRPLSKILIAQVKAGTPAQARKALVKQILDAGDALSYITHYYSILAELYALPVPALNSVKRGIEGMKMVSEREWVGRLEQVRGARVDKGWGLEARLEAFLLEEGWWKIGRWKGAVDVALGLGEEERRKWAETYWEAWGFLEVVGLEVKRKGV